MKLIARFRRYSSLSMVGLIAAVVATLTLLNSGCGESVNFDAVTEHACIHAERGPFRDITAESLASGEGVDVNRAHTAYNLTLPGGTSGHSAVVQYTPKKTAPHVVFIEPDIAVSLAGPDGSISDFSSQSAREICPLLARVQGYDLVADTVYQLTIGPTPHGMAQILWEEVGE